MIDGVQAAGGECSNYGVLSTPQLHFFVVCQNTGGAYGKPSEEGYFQKLGQAFLLFGNGVSKIRFTCAINNASENEKMLRYLLFTIVFLTISFAECIKWKLLSQNKI